MRTLPLLMLALLLLNLVYAMSGNVLWLEKKEAKDTWLVLNETLWDIPINSGESFEIEYDVYVDDYEGSGTLRLMQVTPNYYKNGNLRDNVWYIGINKNGFYFPGRYSASNYTLEDFIDREHHIKMVVKKIDDSLFRIEAYIDGVLVGYDNVRANLANTGKVSLGARDIDDNTFRLAIDNVRIKLPNGTVLFEDFEDSDWNRIFGWVSKNAPYGIAPAPNQSTKAPIPVETIIIASLLIVLFMSRK